MLGRRTHYFDKVFASYFKSLLELMNILATFSVYSSKYFIHIIPDAFQTEGIFVLEEMEFIGVVNEVLYEKG